MRSHPGRDGCPDVGGDDVAPVASADVIPAGALRAGFDGPKEHRRHGENIMKDYMVSGKQKFDNITLRILECWQDDIIRASAYASAMIFEGNIIRYHIRTF